MDLLVEKPEPLKKIVDGSNKPLAPAGIMNSLRHVIKKRLEGLGAPVISQGRGRDEA